MARTARTVWVALALGATILGCGARSSLPVPGDGEDGAGGDRPRATSAATGRPGTGGVANDGGGGAGGLAQGGSGGGGGGVIEECDPDVLFIYAITDTAELYRFDPASATFELIGPIDCPSSIISSPFSMAVSRSGRAYSVFRSGELFRINVKNAACNATEWEPQIGDFHNFGMGYALDDDGLGESLYVADIDQEGGDDSAGLARVDTSTFELERIGPFSSNPGGAIELTSADDGELYGYFLNRTSGGTLVRIDKSSGEILEETFLPLPATSASALAFAYWNSDFYIFTTGGAGTDVTRYRPSLGETDLVATLGQQIVGAGVTTCDPDEAE